MTPPKPVFVFTLLAVLLALLSGITYHMTTAEAAKPNCNQHPTKRCDPQDSTSPTVSLTTPAAHAPGAYTSIDGVLVVEATATDNQDIAKVEFFAGSIELGVDTDPPYQARFDTSVWPNWQTSFVKAVATDTAGNTAEDLRYVQVVRASAIPTPDTQAPNVKVVNPSRHAPGAFTPIDGVIAVEALSDDNVRVASVDFYAGSIHLGTDDAAPWSTTFDTSVWPNGQTSFIKAVAKDGAGNTSDDQIYVIVVRGTTTTPPSALAVCADAKDNDGDGKIDYPADPGCSSATDTDETDATGGTSLAACADKKDNDADGKVDHPTDPGCASLTDTDEADPVVSLAACADKKDNDADGKIDHPADPGCSSLTDTDEANPAPAACEDGKDNDGDGKIDYPADPGCSIPTDVDESNPVLVCSDGKDNDGDGKIDYPADPGCTGPADGDESNAVGAGPKLQWSPPSLSNPVTINVPETGGIGGLDPSRDYVLKLGHRKTGLGVTGGRNVVIIGGQITCQDIVDSNLSRGRGIEVWDNKGTVHIEGVLFRNCGTGLAISAPESTIQVQNCRFEDIDSPWNLMHPDVIQTWRGPKEIRIDRLTADFSSKGLLWMSVNGQFPGRIDQRNINFRLWTMGGPTPDGPHHFTWHVSPTTRSTCQNCWTETGWWQNSYRRRLQDGWETLEIGDFAPYRLVGADGRNVTVETAAEHQSLVNDDLGRRQGDYMEILAANLAGERWHWGLPGGGDFVPTGVSGTGYLSPGYSS